MRWGGGARLIDECSPSFKYGDVMKTVKGLETMLQPLTIKHKGWDCWQTAAEVAWPLLCVIRNVSKAMMAAKQELLCVKKEFQEIRELGLIFSIISICDPIWSGKEVRQKRRWERCLGLPFLTAWRSREHGKVIDATPLQNMWKSQLASFRRPQ